MAVSQQAGRRVAFRYLLSSQGSSGRDTPVKVVRVAVRAFLLGYAASVTPRLVAWIIQFIRPVKDVKETKADVFSDRLKTLRRILLSGFGLHRFPAFCAALLGGNELLRVIIANLRPHISTRSRRLRDVLSAFVAAWLSFSLLRPSRVASVSAAASDYDGIVSERNHGEGGRQSASRTLDLTIFAACRALDIVCITHWQQYKPSQPRRTTRLLSRLADPAIFSFSSALIMWSWVYHPNKLPRSYRNWISAAAQVDERLIVALRQCRVGLLRYGQSSEQTPILQSMCGDYNWPLHWGDPAKSVPFPCEMVHMGCGPSCEMHALNRFVKVSWWALKRNAALQAVLLVLRQNLDRRSLIRGLGSASRSAAFLGAFVGLFYYGVCLTRTRLGPRIVGKDVAARQKIDSGLCVATGCALCGLSILLEKSSRRTELALFVAPRAVATLLPRHVPAGKQWVEQLIFATSAVVVLTAIRKDKPLVRGAFGNLLAGVLDA